MRALASQPDGNRSANALGSADNQRDSAFESF
jgi:hypothetical protein